MNFEDAVNLEDLHKIAKRKLPRFCFDFIEGGVEDEKGLDRNTGAFDHHALVPRYLVDVSEVDQKVELFGRTYASPFGIAPTGIAGLFKPGADLMLAEAAKAANIPFILSGAGTASIEEAARVAPETTWYQMYGSRDFKITEDLVKRTADAGLQTLVWTVDVPVTPRRERNIRNGFKRPLKISPWLAVDALLHPAWTLNYLRNGGLPRVETWAKYAPAGADAHGVADTLGANTPTPNQTWERLEAVRKQFPGNIVLKGIMHPDDAVRAMNVGVDGILVSNHGGRQLDRSAASLEMLPLIREATGGKLALFLDSGIRRGSDAMVARCLGADAVFVGRPTLYGAVAGGRAGADKAIDILQTEIDLNMKQLGCPRFDDLGPDFLFESHTDASNRPPLRG